MSNSASDVKKYTTLKPKKKPKIKGRIPQPKDWGTYRRNNFKEGVIDT